MAYHPERKLPLTEELRATLDDLDTLLPEIGKKNTKAMEQSKGFGRDPIAGNAHLNEAAIIGTNRAIFEPPLAKNRNY